MAAPIIAAAGKAVLSKVATKVVKNKAKNLISKKLGTGADAKTEHTAGAGNDASQLPGSDKIQEAIASGAVAKNQKLDKRFDSFMREQLNVPSEQMLKDSNFGPALSKSFSKAKGLLKVAAPISQIVDKESNLGKLAELGRVNNDTKKAISMEMEAQAFNEPIPTQIEQVSLAKPTNAGKI